jgi:hypothetical protein
VTRVFATLNTVQYNLQTHWKYCIPRQFILFFIKILFSARISDLPMFDLLQILQKYPFINRRPLNPPLTHLGLDILKQSVQRCKTMAVSTIHFAIVICNCNPCYMIELVLHAIIESKDILEKQYDSFLSREDMKC